MMSKTCRIVLGVLIATSLAAGQQLKADDYLDKDKKALDLIAEFADRFCRDVQLETKNRRFELSAGGEAQVRGLLKKLADIGIEASVKYEDARRQGLLQEDLIEALKDTTNCRLHIWDDLKDRLLAGGQAEASVNLRANNGDYALVGEWQQLVFDPRSGGWLSGGTYKVFLEENRLQMAIVETWTAPPGGELSQGVEGVYFDGHNWTFYSRWTVGLAKFELEKIDKNTFEGYSYFNELRLEKNRWIRLK